MGILTPHKRSIDADSDVSVTCADGSLTSDSTQVINVNVILAMFITNLLLLSLLSHDSAQFLREHMIGPTEGGRLSSNGVRLPGLNNLLARIVFYMLRTPSVIAVILVPFEKMNSSLLHTIGLPLA
jgi:hypothetical protein